MTATVQEGLFCDCPPDSDGRKPDAWFDRSICPEPCGNMHYVCETCCRVQDRCLILEQAAVPIDWRARAMRAEAVVEATLALARRWKGDDSRTYVSSCADDLLEALNVSREPGEPFVG